MSILAAPLLEASRGTSENGENRPTTLDFTLKKKIQRIVYFFSLGHIFKEGAPPPPKKKRVNHQGVREGTMGN